MFSSTTRRLISTVSNSVSGNSWSGPSSGKYRSINIPTATSLLESSLDNRASPHSSHAMNSMFNQSSSPKALGSESESGSTSTRDPTNIRGQASGSASASASKTIPTPLDLNLDLDIGIGVWEGKAIFTSKPESIRPKPQRAKSNSNKASQAAEAVEPETPKASKTRTFSQEPSGSAYSPISIASSPPSPSTSQQTLSLPRPRAVPSYTSPLPRTAFTPPRVLAEDKTSTSTSTAHLRTDYHPTSFKTQAAKPIHPFFSRTRTVPTPSQPRYMAHYSSTEASQSQTTDSQSTSASASQVSSNNRATSPTRVHSPLDELAEAVGRLDMEARPWAQRKHLEASTSSIVADNVIGKDKNRAEIKPTTSTNKPRLIAKPVVAQLQHDRDQEDSKTSSVIAAGTVAKEDASPRLPYFHYSTYPSPPKIAYTSHPEEANDLLSCLRGNALGFDLEWPPAGEYTVSIPGGGTMKRRIGMTWDESRRKWIWGQGRTALMQFCDERLVVLVHLGENMDIPTKAIEIIRDPQIYKLGVQVKGDGQKLLRDFPNHFHFAPQPNADSSTIETPSPSASRNIGPAGLLELSFLARAVDPIGTGPGTTLISLANLTKSYLGRELTKPAKVRRGNWFEALDQEARDYAANDVYAALQIYNTLMASAKEQDFTPDLDLYCSQVGVGSSTSSSSRSGGPIKSNNGFFGAGANEVRIGERVVPLPEGTMKPPPPAQLSALGNFMDGMDIQTMADLKEVKLNTVEGYICQALEVLGIEVLQEDDRRRLWDQIPKKSYTWKKCRKTYKALKVEFADGEGAEEGSDSGSGRSEEEEAAERR
ncbi:hypothetical protein IAT40_006732 [Kwoniella sp. CBS 6097]